MFLVERDMTEYERFSMKTFISASHVGTWKTKNVSVTCILNFKRKQVSLPKRENVSQLAVNVKITLCR